MRGLAVLFIALQKGQSNREKPSSRRRFAVCSIFSDFLVLIVADIEFSLSCRRRPQFARILFSAPTIIIT